MPRSTDPFAIATSLFLALGLALVFAVSMKAVLISVPLTTAHIMSAQEASTMNICALAAGLAILVTWGLQTYAQTRPILVRFSYAITMLIITFGSIGGALVVLKNYFLYDAASAPGESALLKGYFWESLSGFYAFAIFMISAMNLALLALFFVCALYIALLGPQKSKQQGLSLHTTM